MKTSDSKFVINGNYTASPSGKYLAAGTVFEYHKVEGNSGESRSDGVTEWITSIGPLLETIHVMVNLRNKENFDDFKTFFTRFSHKTQIQELKLNIYFHKSFHLPMKLPILTTHQLKIFPTILN